MTHETTVERKSCLLGKLPNTIRVAAIIPMEMNVSARQEQQRNIHPSPVRYTVFGLNSVNLRRVRKIANSQYYGVREKTNKMQQLDVYF